MSRIAFVVTYLAGAAAAVILLNANSGDGELAIAIWAVASVLLGWGTGQLGFVFLALLAVPFAVPFGYPDDYQYSEPLPIWWSAMFCAFASAFLIFASVLIRRSSKLVDTSRPPPSLIRGDGRSRECPRDA
ncbi:MAG TPA: hypothetical protein VMR96_04400, partial [Solirubrobacterales bacterium]|nr:hypothetical protein [Solirubrobacterales bacterium]